jgi:hypothetical protein
MEQSDKKKSSKRLVYDGSQKDWEVLEHPLYKTYWKMRLVAIEKNRDAEVHLSKKPNNIECIAAHTATMTMIAVLDQVLVALRDYLQRN